MTRVTPSQTKYTLRVPATPDRMAPSGDIQTGYLLKLIDIAASISARCFAGSEFQVVTAAMDRTDFRAPIRPWDIITLDSVVTQRWNSSFEIQVKVNAWEYLSGTEREVAVAHLVFVGLPRHEGAALPDLLIENAEEKLLAEAADKRKAIRTHEGRELPMVPIDRESDDPVMLEKPMRLVHANAYQNVFGGVLMEWVERAGYLAAYRHVFEHTPVVDSAGLHVAEEDERSLVVARQDRMSFIAPAYIGETLQALAVVTQTWKSSLEVQVEMLALDPTTWNTRRIASSYLVYVQRKGRVSGSGQDSKGEPLAVPVWEPKTQRQKDRVTQANLRREHKVLV